jgi:hypothetical protein
MYILAQELNVPDFPSQPWKAQGIETPAVRMPQALSFPPLLSPFLHYFRVKKGESKQQ